MVKLRLKRVGRKFDAIYRIVAADSRSPRDGRFIEEIGFYNPRSKELRVDAELQAKWLAVGAVPSETVKALFARIAPVKPLAKKPKQEPKTPKATLVKVAKPKAVKSPAKVTKPKAA